MQSHVLSFSHRVSGESWVCDVLGLCLCVCACCFCLQEPKVTYTALYLLF